MRTFVRSCTGAKLLRIYAYHAVICCGGGDDASWATTAAKFEKEVHDTEYAEENLVLIKAMFDTIKKALTVADGEPWRSGGMGNGYYKQSNFAPPKVQADEPDLYEQATRFSTAMLRAFWNFTDAYALLACKSDVLLVEREQQLPGHDKDELESIFSYYNINSALDTEDARTQQMVVNVDLYRQRIRMFFNELVFGFGPANNLGLSSISVANLITDYVVGPLAERTHTNTHSITMSCVSSRDRPLFSYQDYRMPLLTRARPVRNNTPCPRST